MIGQTDIERAARLRDAQRVKALMSACEAGDAERFYYIATADLMPWRLAFRKLAQLPKVPESI